MRKFIFVLAIITSFATIGAFGQAAVDFGGSLSNGTGIELSDETNFSQTNGLSLWFSAKGLRTAFTARGGYTFVYDKQADPQLKNILDVQALNLNGNFPVSVMGLSRFSYDLGRFRFRDHTRYIVDQTLDGVRFGFFYPAVAVRASVATSLLPNKNSSPLILSKADSYDIDPDKGSDVFMGSPRALGLLEVVFSDLLQQELTLSVGFQEDLRQLFDGRADALIEEGQEELEPAGSGLLDTQYLGLGVRGNITGGLFYNTFFSLGTGRTLSYLKQAGAVSGSYAYTPITAFLGGLGLNLYLPAAMSSAAGLNFVLSSGDSWDERNSFYEDSVTDTPALFVPITAKPLSFVLGPSVGNIIFIGGSYSLKPLSFMEGSILAEKLQTAIKFGVFSRYANGPVSVSVPNTDSDKNYLGSEVDLSVSFRPFSDLGFSFNAGVFLPNAGDGGPFDAAGSSSTVTKMEISASFSF